MLGRYGVVLGRPGALAFSAAGLLARTEMAMVGLGSVILVQATTGSYALGGAVAATYGLSHAAALPVTSRLVDRFGQAALLRPAVLVHVAALLGLAAIGSFDGPAVLLFLLAALGGMTEISAGTLVRARWAHLLRGTDHLQTAFALESVVDELTFIVGPVIVTLLATAVHPAGGLLLAALTALVGALLLAARTTTEPPPSPRGPEHRAGGRAPVLAAPGMPVLVIVFLAAGGIFGSAEVAVVATTRQAGAPAAAGVILAVWAAGSLVSGLAYGAIGWRGPLARRFVVLAALLALLTAPMALPLPILGLAVVFFFAGTAIAPTITAGSGLVEAIVPRERLTEGLAWTTTSITITYALGAAVAGAIADAAGGRTALLVPVGCATGTAIVALLGLPRLAAGTRLPRTGQRFPGC